MVGKMNYYEASTAGRLWSWH